MKTQVHLINPEFPEKNAIEQAAGTIRRGGLVAFPTETVYGLGADCFNAAAVARIYWAKGRPSDNPLILHIFRKEQILELSERIPSQWRALADMFWPGPLTMIVEKRKNLEIHGCAGAGTIGVRLPKSPAAQALIAASKTVVCAPSANASGKPSPTEACHVLQDLDGKIDMILDGGPVEMGIESTVIDLTRDEPLILRPGFVTKQMLEAALGRPVGVCADSKESPKSPGMKYRHYAPEAAVTVVSGALPRVVDEIRRLAASCGGKCGILATVQTQGLYETYGSIVLTSGDRDDPKTIGANLFGMLRRFDEFGVDAVYAEGLSAAGLGEAIMNRLVKAAGGRIIEV
ncbi:MAG: threonylcarbamoyl-AMP synthase [Clostridiales bacterium]|jgi:L-threonylcarbamoyladenylate synthase|nr:threonylcarbamoyl-AMP synthase [Clostridiales bacterium]